MDKCKCYHTQFITTKNYSLDCISTESYSVCFGTKECEKCSCGGDRTKCDFYPEVRLKAQKEAIENSLDWKIAQAINLLVENGYEVKKI